MGHHFIPQFYLRGFTDANTIWVHDRLQQRSFPSQPKTVANENNLYTEELEKHLANEIEQPAMSAIDVIRSGSALSVSDREPLARYIVALWKRVPEGRARAASGVPEVAASLREQYQSELSDIAEANPELRERAKARRAQVGEILDRFTREPPPEVWHANLTSSSSPNVVEFLLSMTWRLLRTNASQFLTSDNPVFFFKHEGIGKPDSEVCVPFSSSVTLWANRRELNGPQILMARPAAVRELNRRQAINATRFVYSQSQEDWILPFVCKRSHNPTRLR